MRQYFSVPGSSALHFFSLSGGDQPYLAYTPEKRFEPGRSTHQHVFCLGEVDAEVGVTEMTFRWSLPPEDAQSPGPLLVGVGEDPADRVLISRSGSQVDFSYRFEVTHSDVDGWSYRFAGAFIDGVQVLPGQDQVRTTGSTRPVLGGSAGLAASQSGDYRVSLLSNGSEVDSFEYFQRALTFSQAFPSFENAQLGDVLTITNQLQWDFGDPAVTSPCKWQANAGSDVFPGPTADDWVTGPDIEFGWDTDASRFLRARELQNFRLIPGSSEWLESNRRARAEDQGILSYLVTGRAQTYAYNGSPVWYEVHNGGRFRSRNRTVEIMEPHWEPPTGTVGAPSTFSAGVVATDFEDPVVSWNLEVFRNFDNEETVAEFSGPEASDADPFQVLRGFIPVVADGYFANLSVTVQERSATDPDGLPIEVTANEPFIPLEVREGGARGVQIQATVTPDTLSDGGTIQYRAQVLPQGYASPELTSWSLSVVNDQSVPVKTFDSVALSGLTIVRDWDGLDDTQQQVPPGRYRFLLNVEVCEAGAHGTQPRAQRGLARTEDGLCQPGASSTEFTVAMAGGPRLEVLDSENVRLAAGPLESPPSGDQLQLLNHVFPYGTSGTSPTWTVQAQNLVFVRDGIPGAPAPPEVTVTLKSQVSGVEKTLALHRVGQSSKFMATFPLGSDFILDNKDLVRNGQPVKTTFTAVNSFPDDDSQTFLRLMQETAGSSHYQQARAQLGYFQDLGISFESPPDHKVQCLVDNVRTFGFEPVHLLLSRAQGDLEILLPTGEDGIRAVVKVRHPASVVFISSHGDQAGVLYLDDNRQFDMPPQRFVPGESFTTADSSDVKTLILSACLALDLHDFNNSYQIGLGRKPTDRIAKRPSPGKLWFEATGSGNTTLLGYNYTAGGEQAPTVRAFLSEVDRLRGRTVVVTTNSGAKSSEVIDDGNIQQLAWISANRKVSPSLSVQAAVAGTLPACAWDSKYYYFISFYWADVVMEEPGSIRGLYRIPRRSWDVDLTNWDRYPPVTAEKIEVN